MSRISFIGLIILCRITNYAIADNITANFILDGIEYNRSLVKSGVVNIEITKADMIRAKTEQSNISLLFEDSKIRFDKTYPVIVFPVEAMPKDITGRDPARVLEEIGHTEIVTEKFIRTNQDAFVFKERYQSVNIKDPFVSDIEREIFGIETIGIALEAEQNMKFSLKQLLATLRGGNPTVIGIENIDGQECYHLRMRYDFGPSIGYGQEIDMWVDANYGFSVVQLEAKSTNNYARDIITTKYNKINDYWIPTSMVRKSYKRGNLIEEENWKILITNLNQDVKDDAFTLMGLNIPNGARIRDDRVGIDLGTWPEGLSGDLIIK